MKTTYEFLADGRPVQLSTRWGPYDLTVGKLVVLPEVGPHTGARFVNCIATEEASLLGIQKAALVTHIRRTYYSSQGQSVNTADIVLPAAHCEIVHEIPLSR